MIVRLAVVAAVLGSFVWLGIPSTGTSVTFQAPTANAAPAAAPAATQTNGLLFSGSVSSDGQPDNPRTEFDSSTPDVWASFEFRDHNPNTNVTYLVRANGEDYRDGELNCCDQSSGRFAFQIEKRGGGGDLPGAAYDVRVYANDVEIAQGGFGVNGRGGLDNDGEDYNDDNDNN